jgi:hypothetical protein
MTQTKVYHLDEKLLQFIPHSKSISQPIVKPSLTLPHTSLGTLYTSLGTLPHTSLNNPESVQCMSLLYSNEELVDRFVRKKLGSKTPVCFTDKEVSSWSANNSRVSLLALLIEQYVPDNVWDELTTTPVPMFPGDFYQKFTRLAHQFGISLNVLYGATRFCFQEYANLVMLKYLLSNEVRFFSTHTHNREIFQWLDTLEAKECFLLTFSHLLPTLDTQLLQCFKKTSLSIHQIDDYKQWALNLLFPN